MALPPGSHLRPPSTTVVIPSTSVTVTQDTSTTATGVPKKQQISSLVSHLGKSDPHLHQALISLQSQANSIVGSTGQWTSWTPRFREILSDKSIGRSLPLNGMLAYYMVSGMLLFVEIHGQIAIFPSTTYIEINMPVNVGTTIIKTCAAYLTQVNSPAFNGIAALQIQGESAIVTIGFSFQSGVPTNGVACGFMMGGAIGIIQGA